MFLELWKEPYELRSIQAESYGINFKTNKIVKKFENM